MIELFFEVFIDNRVKILNMLRTPKLLVANNNMCKSITISSISVFSSLVSNHEEAKVILHCLQEYDDVSINLRSPSGDTDIIVLAVMFLHQFRNQIYLDNGSGSSRKCIWLGNVYLPMIMKHFPTVLHPLGCLGACQRSCLHSWNNFLVIYTDTVKKV